MPLSWLGLLLVYAPRAPVFANSDLELVQLLADQAAVILESRALIDEAAQVAAREEAARLKEDFLSSAAHDLTLDAPRFEQVLTNLVENALKYSPHDSPVVVRVWQTDDEARLSVQDRGIGVPIEDQALVFDRFHRARNVDDRRFAGMGLGLYIARSIVEQHGGRIWLDSPPGSGSTFFVALPTSPPHSADTISPYEVEIASA